MTAPSTAVRIGVLVPGDPGAPAPAPGATRFRRIFEELAAQGAEAVPLMYHDAVAAEVRERLLTLDGVLVWVDPIVEGRNRTVLDALLRAVAAQGVFVSAHPDVILKMGTKDVLHRTRGMGWGSDTRRYATWDELAAALPAALATGPRVLKQHRGNGGNGVWKVEAAGGTGRDSTVSVQHALRGASVETLRLDAFLERCRPYFAGGAPMFDQPYQARLADGMIRCYFVHDRVVGFGQQAVTALLPPAAGAAGPPDPEPRRYSGADTPECQPLRRLLESGWVAELQRLLDIETAALPVVWDADFLLGPRTPAGEDTYVLCEINVSSVFPIPEEAPAPLAAAAIARTLEARAARA
jgi:hypothetical protein